MKTSNALMRESLAIRPYISATLLAALNELTACERCFALTWLLNQQPPLDGRKYPYRIPLPGVFQVIDSRAKSAVRLHLSRTGTLPPWFPEIGHTVHGYLAPARLHYRRYRTVDPDTSIDLCAAPDDIFIITSGHYIVDYKCASLADAQDTLFPKYQAQLAIEACIGTRLGLTPVAGGLVYLVPDIDAADPGKLDLPFTPVVRPVDLDLDLARRVLRQARAIIDTVGSGNLPAARPDCCDCALLRRILEMLATFRL
jgi:hypothetical protein